MRLIGGGTFHEDRYHVFGSFDRVIRTVRSVESQGAFVRGQRDTGSWFANPWDRFSSSYRFLSLSAPVIPHPP